MALDDFGCVNFADRDSRANGQLSVPDLNFTQGGQTTYIQQILTLQGTGAHIDHHIGAPGENSSVRSVFSYEIKGLVEILRPYIVDIKHFFALGP